MNLSIADSAALSTAHPSITFCAMGNRFESDRANLVRALRNTRCDAIRATIKSMPASGTFKVPTKRDEVIALLAHCGAHLAAYGYVRHDVILFNVRGEQCPLHLMW